MDRTACTEPHGLYKNDLYLYLSCQTLERKKLYTYFPILLNLLTPNVNYSGRTAPLTSKVAFYIFIQQI